jgi:hypothetical protein
VASLEQAMTLSISFQNRPALLLTWVFLVLLTRPHARADEATYRFVAQETSNSFDRYLCVGLAGAIECLEDGISVEGIETSTDMADRLWNKLTGATNEEFVYREYLQLRDGARTPICSKTAIKEIGLLIQEKYEQTVNELWQVGVEPDPNTTEGRLLLQKRKNYSDGCKNKLTSERALKDLLGGDKDGLMAFSGRGHRYFTHGPPQKLIDKYNLKIDPRTGRYAPVPSWHAFLLTYDQDEGLLYVYDSDDPDRKWLVSVKDNENRFLIEWQIDDHLGNGPSRQSYFEASPLTEWLADVRDIAEGDGEPTKTIKLRQFPSSHHAPP